MTQSNRRETMRAAIVILVLVATAAAVTAVYRTSRPPARRQLVVPVDPNQGWETAYAQATANLGTVEQTTQARQAFVDRYPRSPGTADVLNQLGGMYLQQRRFAESIRAYESAKRLVAQGTGRGGRGDGGGGGGGRRLDPSLGILDINLAQAHREAGDLARAEEILNQVIARPLPAQVEVETYVPQAFVGPLALAELRQQQKRPADAEALRKATADRAIQLAAAHPSAGDWILSYAADAYMKRINALLETQPPNLAAARALAAEFKQRVPAYNGPFGYDDMLAGATMAEMPGKGGAASPAPSPSSAGR